MKTLPPRPRERRTDRLLEQIREHVREVDRLRKTAAGEGSLEQEQRVVGRLQEQLADEIRKDPIGGQDSWGRFKSAATW